MNVRRIVALITVTCLTVPLLGCGNNTSTPTAPSSPSQGGNRNVRFEATGNYSGRLTAAFVLANGANTVEEIPSLPWTKDVSYPATARATISELPPGANGTTSRSGLLGQAGWARTVGSHKADAAALPATSRWRRLTGCPVMGCLLVIR